MQILSIEPLLTLSNLFCREYKEALKQQRNQEISVYKQKHPNANQSPNDEELPRLTNGSTSTTATTTLPKSIMKQPSSSSSSNGHNGNGIDDVVIPKKPIQKVIPSRNTELMSSQKSTTTTATSSQEASNGAHCLGYVKPHSPMKNGHGVLTQSNNNKFNTSNGSNGAAGAAASTAGSGLIKSPVSAGSKLGNAVKTHRTVTWNHDIPAEKLSFTMRREFDRQREETELMSQLRSVSVAIV